MAIFDNILNESTKNNLPIRVHFYRDNAMVAGLVMYFDENFILISCTNRYKAEAAKAVIARKYISYVELLVENNGYYIS